MPKVKEYFFTSQDRDSHAELDMLFSSKPETSIRIYFDGKIILEYIKDENKTITSEVKKDFQSSLFFKS